MTNNIKIVKTYLLLLLIFIANINVFGFNIEHHKDSILKKSIYSEHLPKDYRYIKIGKNIVRNPLVINSNNQNAKRGIAIAITILTGPLGGHRIYLGTKPIVPVVYAATLGGVCTLPIIDLIHLIVTKDISRFENNDKIFMWIKEKE